MLNDEEYMKLVIEAQEREKEDGQPSRPLQHTWSPQIEALTKIYDAVRENTAATVAAAGGRPPEFKAFPRPDGVRAKLLHEQRLTKHRALVARVLPKSRTTAEMGAGA